MKATAFAASHLLYHLQKASKKVKLRKDLAIGILKIEKELDKEPNTYQTLQMAERITKIKNALDISSH